MQTFVSPYFELSAYSVNYILQVDRHLSAMISWPPAAAADTSSEIEFITLGKGLTEIMTFNFHWTLNTDQQWTPDYTIGYKGKDPPFCGNGNFRVKGLKDNHQKGRFVSSHLSDLTVHSCKVILEIQNVSKKDEGDFESKLYILYNDGEQNILRVMKTVNVLPPPRKAVCMLLKEENESFCITSHDANLTCFQNYTLARQKEHNTAGIKSSVIFAINFTLPLSCCSHFKNHDVTPETCNDFEIPIIVPPTAQSQPTTFTTGTDEERGEISIATETEENLIVRSGCNRQCLSFIFLSAVFLIQYLVFSYISDI